MIPTILAALALIYFTRPRRFTVYRSTDLRSGREILSVVYF